jgi:hypothetical protein
MLTAILFGCLQNANSAHLASRQLFAELPRLAPNEEPRIKLAVRNKIRKIDLSLYALGERKWPNHFKGYAGWPEIFINDVALHLAPCRQRLARQSRNLVEQNCQIKQQVKENKNEIT